MYDIMRKIGTNVTIGSNVEFKNKVVFGDSILVYRKKRDGKTRKIIKEEVLPEEEPEIFEFLENNNFNFIRVELANDLVIFYDAYLEYILSNDPKSPKLVQIKAKEATCSRISEIDEKTGKSEWHGYSAEWKKGTPEDLVATPLLDRQTPLLDLKKRMGLAPDDEGNLVIGKIADSFTICVFRRQDAFIIVARTGGAYLLQDGMTSPVLFPSSRNL